MWTNGEDLKISNSIQDCMGVWVEFEEEQGNEGEGGKEGDRDGGACLRFNCRNSKVPWGH